MFSYVVHYIDIHTCKALQYDKDQVKWYFHVDGIVLFNLTTKKNLWYPSCFIWDPGFSTNACTKRELSNIIFGGRYNRMSSTSWFTVRRGWNNQTSSGWLSRRGSLAIWTWSWYRVGRSMHCFPLPEDTFPCLITLTEYHLWHFSFCLLQGSYIFFQLTQLASVDVSWFFKVILTLRTQ